MGGPDTPAIGFAAGEERLISLIAPENLIKEPLDFYIVSMEEKYDIEAMKLANEMREYLRVQTNISARSFSSQMKYANKIDAEYTIVIGEDEIKNKTCKIKHMKTGKEISCKLNIENILDALEKIFL